MGSSKLRQDCSKPENPAATIYIGFLEQQGYSRDADGLRASEVEHAVEDGDGDPGFDLLRRPAMGGKVSPMMRLYRLIAASAPSLAL